MFDIPIQNKVTPAMDFSSLGGIGMPTQGQTQGYVEPMQQYQQPMQQQQQQQYQQQQQQQQQQPMQQQYQQPMQQQYGVPSQAVAQQTTPQGGGVILAKGQKVSLSKMNPNLDLIEVGLGWDLSSNGQSYDLDVEAFLLGQNGKVLGDDWFVFYNQPCSPDGAVKTCGDNKTGDGYGDDEVISVKLSQLNQGVAKVVFIVTINEAKEKGYNFSNVQNAYVRIVDKVNGRELVRFNLTDYYSSVCSMMVGELYLHNGDWKFNPIGDGTSDDLLGLCLRYGVNVAG